MTYSTKKSKKDPKLLMENGQINFDRRWRFSAVVAVTPPLIYTYKSHNDTSSLMKPAALTLKNVPIRPQSYSITAILGGNPKNFSV